MNKIRDALNWLYRGLSPIGHLFSHYPLIFLPLAVFFAIHWGQLLLHFEAFQVIWSDSWFACVVTGIMIAVLCGGAMTACWWLDGRRPKCDGTPGATNANPDRDAARHVAAWVWLCLFAMAPALFGAFFRPDDGQAPPDLDKAVWWFGFHRARFLVPLGLALALGTGLVISSLPQTKKLQGKWLWRLGWWPPIVVAVGYVALSLIHLLWSNFYLSFLLPWPSAAHTAILLLAVLVFAGTGLHRYGYSRPGRHWFYPAVIGAPLAYVLLGGYLEPIHQVPNLGHYHDNPKERPRLDEYMTSGRYHTVPGGQAKWALVPDMGALKAWTAVETNKTPATDPVVVLSVSGGASTSAVFVARSLFRMEAHHPGFLGRIRIICGASGGMLGAAHFVAQFRPGSPYRAEARVPGYAEFRNEFFGKRKWTDYDPENKAPTPEDFRTAYEHYQNDLKNPSRPEADRRKAAETYLAGMDAMERRFMEGIKGDFLSPVFEKWVHKDLNPIVRYFPQSTENDRGAALEAAWNDLLKGRPKPGPRPAPGTVSWDWDAPCLDVPFGDVNGMRGEERAGLIPSLVFTPMLVEDGRQLIISNLDLNYMVSMGTLASTTDDPPGKFPNPNEPPKFEGKLPPDVIPSISAVEFYRLFPQATEAFTLATAVRLNATFPALSPAAELPTNPPRRVVDAGYYDNYGLVVAARWIDDKQAWFRSQHRSVWVVQLWTYGYTAERRSLVTDEEEKLLRDKSNYRAVPGAGLRSSTLPLGAIYNAWDASMANRGEERLNGVLARMNVDRWNENLGRKPEQRFAYPAAERLRKDINNLDVPMNWVLSKKSLAALDKASQDFQEIAEQIQTKPNLTSEQRVQELKARPRFQQMSPEAKAGLEEKVILADKLSGLSHKSNK